MGIDSFHSVFIDSAWVAMTALGFLAGLAWAGLPRQLGWAWLMSWLDAKMDWAGLGQAPEGCPRHPKRSPKWSPKRVVFASIWKGPFEDHVLLT